jgi:clan AA aspartic protease
MGLTHATIELLNGVDTALQRLGRKKTARKVEVKALVDSGAYMMAINEKVRKLLNLPTISQRNAVLADGSKVLLDIVGPLEVRFANREATCNAMVFPSDDAEILLGAIPMEEMDVVIHPQTQQLVVNPQHPDRPQLSMKGFQKG